MYWAEYLGKTHALVYVVDSSDRRRLPQAKAEIHRLLRLHSQLPVVVLGNKQVTLTIIWAYTVYGQISIYLIVNFTVRLV